MKIIDLAEKQRNNEILPKHIRYENEDLYFDGVTYYDKEGNNDLFDILAMNNNALTHLYDKVEIIEEDKNIEKLQEIENGDFLELPTTHDLMNKINELIDEINNLKKKVK